MDQRIKLLQELRFREIERRRQEQLRQMNNPVAQIERECFIHSHDVNFNPAKSINFECEVFSNLLA